MISKKKDLILFSLIFAICFSFLSALVCNFYAKNSGVYFAKSTISSHNANDSYEVVYNANGGTGEMAKSYFTYGTSKNLFSNSFTREGYTFTEWNTKADGTGTSYADGAKVKNLTTNASITLYAQWINNKYNVKYNANDGVGTMQSSCFTYGVAGKLRANTFTREGYTFDGWNTKADGTGTSYDDQASISGISEINGETVVLYAKWKGINYSIRYNANGGLGTMANSSHVYGVSKRLNANTFTKSGLSFLAWNTKADGTGEYYSNGNKVINLTNTADSVVDLYAIYTEVNDSSAIFTYDNGTELPKDSSGNYIVYNNLTKYKVSYVSDSHGTINPNSEMVVINKNPLFLGDLPDSGYKLLMIKCNRSLDFNDNSSVSANKAMSPEKFRKAKITEDLICNLTHKLYTPKNYSCNLANSDGTCN